MAKYLDENGLLYYNQKLGAKFNSKVDKEYKTGSQSEYKVLSDNNLTDELVTKINNAGDSSFTGNYTDLTNKPQINNVELKAGNNTLKELGMQPAGNNALSSEIPTDNSQLANGAGYQTASQVQSAISEAIGGINEFEVQIVEELPGTGETGVIYLVSNDGSGQNAYDEFIWTGTAFEKIGSTDVNLSNYWSKTELTAIQNSDIDTIVGA